MSRKKRVLGKISYSNILSWRHFHFILNPRAKIFQSYKALFRVIKWKILLLLKKQKSYFCEKNLKTWTFQCSWKGPKEKETMRIIIFWNTLNLVWTDFKSWQQTNFIFRLESFHCFREKDLNFSKLSEH